MQEILEDKVEVTAVFSQGKLTPRSFVWRDKIIPVRSVVFSYRQDEGATPLLYFAVAGETATYELEFNLKTFVWRLTKVFLPGS